MLRPKLAIIQLNKLTHLQEAVLQQHPFLEQRFVAVAHTAICNLSQPKPPYNTPIYLVQKRRVDTPAGTRTAAAPYMCDMAAVAPAERFTRDPKTCRGARSHSLTFRSTSAQQSEYYLQEAVLQQRPILKQRLVAVAHKACAPKHKPQTSDYPLENPKICPHLQEAVLQQCPVLEQRLVAVAHLLPCCHILLRTPHHALPTHAFAALAALPTAAIAAAVAVAVCCCSIDAAAGGGRKFSGAVAGLPSQKALFRVAGLCDQTRVVQRTSQILAEIVTCYIWV